MIENVWMRYRDIVVVFFRASNKKVIWKFIEAIYYQVLAQHQFHLMEILI